MSSTDASVAQQMLAIDDWRHPYEIEGQPNNLDKEWFRDWHPWRWSVDMPVIDHALDGLDGKTVLDVACNDGWYGFQAHKAGATITGIDGRQEAIDRANLISRYYKFGRTNHFVGDIEDEDALSGEFDATLFYGILYHLADPIRVLARMGEVTKRIIAVQTFIHALDKDPTLHLFRESPELAGNALTQLITTPTQRAVVMMLREAGFDHVYRAMPRKYLAANLNSNARWQWCFFYGVKGDPLSTSSTLVEIGENDPPLNHFGFLKKLAGHGEQFARRVLNRQSL